MDDQFRDNQGRFKPGNPGKPKGATDNRKRLSDAFIRTLAEDFEQMGAAAIVDLRENNPGTYANVIAKLMPKLMELSGPDGEPIAHQHDHNGIRFWDPGPALKARTRDPLVEGDD